MATPVIFKRYECYIDWNGVEGDLRPYRAIMRLKNNLRTVYYSVPTEEQARVGWMLIVHVYGDREVSVKKFAAKVLRVLLRYKSVTINAGLRKSRRDVTTARAARKAREDADCIAEGATP